MKEHDELKKQGKADAPVSPDPVDEIKPSEYLREVEVHLKNGKPLHAYSLATEAVSKYPENPLVVSHYGHLQTVADAKYRTGIETCKRAIVLAGEKGLFGEEGLYAVLYLNLGRTYLSAGMKQDAVDKYLGKVLYKTGNKPGGGQRSRGHGPR